VHLLSRGRTHKINETSPFSERRIFSYWPETALRARQSVRVFRVVTIAFFLDSGSVVLNLFRITTRILPRKSIAIHMVLLHLQDKKVKKNINLLESIQLKTLLATHRKSTVVATHSLRNAGI